MVDDTTLKQKLLDAGLLDEDRIDDAMDRVERDGGDLASQLLLTTNVDEESLLGILAELRDVEPADPNDYERIDPDALATIEFPLLKEYSIIPFQMHRRNLGVFVVEPLDDAAISELSETHDVRITEHIWPRLRFHQTMHALFDEPLPEWAQGTDEGLEFDFADDLDVPAVDRDDLSSNSSPSIGRPVSETLKYPKEVDHAALGVGWSQQQMFEFIDDCYSRDAVLYSLLGYAEWWLENRMIVVLGKDSIQPYLIAGWSELPDEFRDNERLRQLRIPVDPSAAIFDADQVGHFLADKPEDVGLGDLFVELTLFPPDRLLNQAVKIGNRPYMLLVGEPRDELPEHPPGMNRLEEVAVRVGEQLESIIRAAKADELPEEDDRLPAIPQPDGSFEQEVGDLEALEEASEADRGDEGGDPHEQTVSPGLEIDDSPRSGRTLDGTGESYADLKENAENEISAPKLGGSSEPQSARQTQHIGSEASELDQDQGDISAPQLDTESEAPRQTQSIPPGMSTSSSVMDDESEADEPEHDVSSTSFGIPFMDDSPDDSPDDESDAEPSDESEPSDQVEPSEPSEAEPDEPSEPEPSEPSEAEPDEPSEPESDEPSEPELHEPPGTESDEPSEPDEVTPEPQDASSTMLGGFLVDDSSSFGTDEASASSVDDDEDDEPGESVEELTSDEDGPSLETLDSGDSFAEAASSAEQKIPRSQIVRFISLANGRKTLQGEESETSDDESLDEASGSSVVELTSEASESSVVEDVDEIPKIEPSSSSLESGSVAFTDEDLQETADLLDSRNPANAFNAAEQIVEWGGRAVQVLSERFPGRLFVDRYEYTSSTMPPAEEHGPVIAALSKLDGRAVSVVEDYLEDTSVELRFYATLLFRELPVDSVTDKLIERLFDRDKMIRDIASEILIERTDQDFRDNTLKPRLHDEVEQIREDLRVEVSARLLGQLKDRYAVPTLIDALAEVDGKVQSAVQEALTAITFKKLSPSASEWRNWWTSAHEKSREDWLVDALNSGSEDVRQLAYREIQEYDGLDIDYHPDQPKKLRSRAQKHLREWFDNQ